MPKDFFRRPGIRNVVYGLLIRLQQGASLPYVVNHEGDRPIAMFNVDLFRVLTNNGNYLLSIMAFISVVVCFRSRFTSNNERRLPWPNYSYQEANGKIRTTFGRRRMFRIVKSAVNFWSELSSQRVTINAFRRWRNYEIRVNRERRFAVRALTTIVTTGIGYFAIGNDLFEGAKETSAVEGFELCEI